MAADIHKVDFQISATDQASRVIQGVAGSVKGLHGNFIALAGAATAALGAGGVAAFVADAVRYRGALDDLSDTTGDNVRTLDAMARQARISGLEFENLSSGLTKFARNLNAAGDEGKDAAQALAAIGLNVEELRAKKPADAMLDVARALGQFEDGAGKVAVAVALMGKEGAKQLPFLKDLAEAGELQGKITAEEAAQAERLEKEWRKLTQAFIDGKQAIASYMIPAIGDLIEQMRKGIEVAGSFGGALRLFGMGIAPGDVSGRLKEKQKELEDWQGAGAMGRFFKKPLGATYAGTEGDLKKQIEFLQFMQRQEALRGRTGAEFEDARDVQSRRKPGLDFAPAKPGRGGKGGAAGEDYTHLFAVYEMQVRAEKELLQLTKDQNTALEDQRKIREAIADQREKSDAIVTQALFNRDRGGVIPFDEDTTGMEDVKRQVKETNDFAREMGLTFSSAFEDAIRGGKKFSDVLKGIGNDILGIMLRKNVTEPLGNWASGLFGGKGGAGGGSLGGGFLGSLSSFFGGLGGGGAGMAGFGSAMMAYDKGTDYVPYDMVAKIHQGEKIIPAAENRGGGAAPVINLHFHSADAQGARALLMQHSETIENIVRRGYNSKGRSPGF